MSEARGAARSRWTRRVPGSAVLLFFFLSAALWLACVLSYQFGQPDFVVGLLALSAVFPLAWLGIGLRTNPVWALQVPAEPSSVAGAVVEAARLGRPTLAARSEVGRGGLFRGCDPILRIEEPRCFVGIYRSPLDSWTTVLLLPRSRDRAALNRFRSTIETRVAHSR
jgi:hypothetical protein